MVASNTPVATSRIANPDLDEDAPVQQPAPSSVRAYAPAPVIAPQAPVAATLVSTVPASGVPVRTALPPSRPFDLDTIANSASPVLLRTGAPAARPAIRGGTSMTSLFAAPDQHPTARFARNHPLASKVVPQGLQPLARN
jgi:rare lipoprotein A